MSCRNLDGPPTGFSTQVGPSAINLLVGDQVDHTTEKFVHSRTGLLQDHRQLLLIRCRLGSLQLGHISNEFVQGLIDERGRVALGRWVALFLLRGICARGLRRVVSSGSHSGSASKRMKCI